MDILKKSLFFKTLILPLLILIPSTAVFLYYLIDIKNPKLLTLILVYFVLFFLIVNGIFFWLFVIRPLHKLSRSIESAKSGDFLVRSEVLSSDELGELAQSFNHMLSRITDLMANDIEREREVITIKEELKYKRLLEKRSRQIEKINRELQSRLKEITILYDTISSMTMTINLEELLNRIAQKVGESLGYKEFAILLMDEKVRKLKVVVSYGLPKDEFFGMEFDPGEGIVGRVFNTGEPELIKDTTKDPSYLHWKGKKIEQGSFLAIPVKFKNEVLGVFAFNNPQVDGFSKRDIKLLTAVANQSAIVIENARLYERTKELSIRDELTGLYNRRWFNQRIVEEVKRAERFNNALSILMIDIDFFKHYNDHLGHSTGDMALRDVANILRENVREVDMVVRYGGEEFVVILPKTGDKEARIVAESLRKKLEESKIPYGNIQPGGRFTISIGYSTFPVKAKDINELINQADRALYIAKERGRNLVVGYGSESD